MLFPVHEVFLSVFRLRMLWNTWTWSWVVVRCGLGGFWSFLWWNAEEILFLFYPAHLSHSLTSVYFRFCGILYYLPHNLSVSSACLLIFNLCMDWTNKINIFILMFRGLVRQSCNFGQSHVSCFQLFIVLSRAAKCWPAPLQIKLYREADW